MIPTAAWPLGLGLLVTSPILFGNVGLSLVGPVPIIKEEIGTSRLSKQDKVRIWSLFFNSSATYIVGGTFLTAGLHAIAAFTAPDHFIRNLSIISALSSLSIIPWTLTVIMPTNKALLQMNEKQELSSQEEGDVMRLITTWDTYHKVRYIGYGVGWATGLAALMATVRIA
ncbi:DUF1772-domain-containing protein [Mollisia scopiformis]|uniref:DUF1772-domain-containing protein n=1 Tax=Mollisia scopiformis TaxID=149040 RepID=A0A132B4B2_MOLSC|nr:DUF1772-domain-containing protein [Mollisia scopiformis]KUJ07073.1 DUF1772-domain-containing protein [Mollisia scopiformis]